MKISRSIGLAFAVVLLITALTTVLAQEQEMTTPLDLAGEPLVLEFFVGAAGPPDFEPLTDGRLVFKVEAEGSVSGAFEGTMRSAITEVNPDPPIFQGLSITFTIETEDGVLEGYYTGTIYHPEPDAPIATVHAHGQILSVSGAYADLFLADVFVASEVQFVEGRSTGETGTMTITAL